MYPPKVPKTKTTSDTPVGLLAAIELNKPKEPLVVGSRCFAKHSRFHCFNEGEALEVIDVNSDSLVVVSLTSGMVQTVTMDEVEVRRC